MSHVSQRHTLSLSRSLNVLQIVAGSVEVRQHTQSPNIVPQAMEEDQKKYLILYLVVPWVARISDLRSLNLVSRGISLLTHPYLFKSIRVDIQRVQDGKQPTSPKLEALMSGWHLAIHLWMLTLRLETYGHQGLALASELIRSLPNLKTLVVKFDILAAQNLPQDQFISRSIDFELIARSISRHQLCSLRLASSSHLFDCSTSVLHAAGKGLKQIDLGNAQVSNQFLEALIDGGRESIESLWLPFSVISPYASRPSLCRIKCSKLKRIGFSTRQGIDMRPFLEANPWINELICGGRIGEVVSACPSAESVVFTNKIPELECIDALRNLPSFSTLRRLRFGTLDGPTLGFESCLRSLPSLEYLSCSGHQLGVDDCNNSGEYYDALFSGGSSIALTQIYTCSFPSLQFVEMIECPFRFIGLPLPPLIEYYGGLRGESNLLRWKFEDVYDLRLLTPSMINSVQMARARQWVEVISSLIDVQTREFVTRAPKLQRARFRPYAYPYDSDLDVIIKRHTNGDYFVLGGFGRDDAGGLSEGDKRFFTQLQYDGPWTTSWK